MLFNEKVHNKIICYTIYCQLGENFTYTVKDYPQAQTAQLSRLLVCVGLYMNIIGVNKF